MKRLDRMHHVAVEVDDVAAAAAWYKERFRCGVDYQDESWAMLRFANMRLALVLRGDHPPHVGFVHPEAARFGPLTPHRDSMHSIYLTDPAGNSVELLAAEAPHAEQE